MVDEGEVGAVTTAAKGFEKFGNLLAGEDVREGFFALDFDLGPDFPGVFEMIAIEGAQRTDGLVEGGGGEFALRLEVDEEVEDLAGIELGQVLIGVV
jgi:hypothetical protein